jgi:hypothetical protein
MTNTTEQDRNAELRDANSCIAFGASLGAVGTGTALLAGATCPLCFVLAPALIGFGVWKRFTADRRDGSESATGPQNRVRSESDG